MSALRIFVRRGAIRRFHLLKRDATGLPVSVEWDRRRSDGRSGEEAGSANVRKVERRGAAPFTWDTADFVVVEEPAVPVGTGKSSK